MRITIGQLRKIIRESIRQSLMVEEEKKVIRGEVGGANYYSHGNPGYTYGLPGHVLSQVTKFLGKFDPEEIEGSRSGSEKGNNFSIAFTFAKAPGVKLDIKYTLTEESDDQDKTLLDGTVELSMDDKNREKAKPKKEVFNNINFGQFMREVFLQTKNYIEDNELFVK